MALTCCSSDCRQGRDCPHRAERDIAELARDRITYACAFVAWFFHHHTGPHRIAKARRWARSETILARKARAERAGRRGLTT